MVKDVNIYDNCLPSPFPQLAEWFKYSKASLYFFCLNNLYLIYTMLEIHILKVFNTIILTNGNLLDLLDQLHSNIRQLNFDYQKFL